MRVDIGVDTQCPDSAADRLTQLMHVVSRGFLSMGGEVILYRNYLGTPYLST